MLGWFFYSMLLQSLHLLMGGDYRALRGASKSPYGCSPGTGSGGRSPSAGQSPSPAASRKKKARPRPFHAAAPPSIPAAEAVLYYTDICPSPFFFIFFFFAKRFISVCSKSSIGWMDFMQETYTTLQCTAVLWNLAVKKHLVGLASALY